MKNSNGNLMIIGFIDNNIACIGQIRKFNRERYKKSNKVYPIALFCFIDILRLENGR